MPMIGMQRLGQRSLKLSKGQLRGKLIPRQRLVAIRIAKAKCTKVSSHLSLDGKMHGYAEYAEVLPVSGQLLIHL